MSTIRMLGLDPSLTNTGWAVLDVDTETLEITGVRAMDTIVTAPSKNKKVRKSSDKLERARTIAKTIAQVIREHDIKIATSEVPSGAQSANAAFAFGIVTGILASLSVPVIEVSPSEVKVAACGSKIADKEDIMRWAVDKTTDCPVKWKTSKKANEFEIEYEGGYVTKTMEHQADAIAAGEAAIQSEQFRQIAGILASVLS